MTSMTRSETQLDGARRLAPLAALLNSRDRSTTHSRHTRQDLQGQPRGSTTYGPSATCPLRRKQVTPTAKAVVSTRDVERQARSKRESRGWLPIASEEEEGRSPGSTEALYLGKLHLHSVDRCRRNSALGDASSVPWSANHRQGCLHHPAAPRLGLLHSNGCEVHPTPRRVQEVIRQPARALLLRVVLAHVGHGHPMHPKVRCTERRGMASRSGACPVLDVRSSDAGVHVDHLCRPIREGNRCAKQDASSGLSDGL